MEKEKKTKAKYTKIILALFLAALLCAGAMDLLGDKFLPAGADACETQGKSLVTTLRNKRIDSILATVKRSADSVYTDADIESAVATVKESFKSKPECVSLVKISFDEKKCNTLKQNSAYSDDYDESNLIVLVCAYHVYQDYEAYSAGYYPDFQQILARSDRSSPWEIIDGGYC